LNPHYQTALERFFDSLYQALLRHVDFATAKAVLLASPAYVREDFKTFLMEQAVRKRDTVRSQCLQPSSCVCLDAS
jgi:protein pelota